MAGGPAALTAEKFTYSFQSLPGNADRYQADYIDSGQILAAGGAVSTQGRLFAGAKKVVADHYKDELGIPNFDLAIDFGFGSIFNQAIFLCYQLVIPAVWKFWCCVLAFTACGKAGVFSLANKPIVRWPR